jgi:hypothetical protein
MIQEADCPILLLASGQSLKMRSVMLYEETRVREIASLQNLVVGKLGQLSTGISSIGSPGWVLGASSVLVFENSATNAAKKEGLEILRKIEALSKGLRETATYCDARELENRHLPHPNLWFFHRVQTDFINIREMGWSERREFLRRHNKSKSDIHDNQISLAKEMRYVHNGDEFINVNTDIGPMNIRWSAVVAYTVPQVSNTPATL